MAIFHCPISIIQRSKGRSVVAAAAYRSGKLKKLQAQAALFNLLNGNGITTMQQIYAKKAAEKLEKEQPSQSRKKEDHEL